MEQIQKDYPDLLKYDNCPCAARSLFEITGLKNHISPDEIWDTYIPMGFEQFKIEGRTSGTFNLLEHYMYYMAKPECRDQARYVFLKWLTENGVIRLAE